jgi:hypothetical protein
MGNPIEGTETMKAEYRAKFEEIKEWLDQALDRYQISVKRGSANLTPEQIGQNQYYGSLLEELMSTRDLDVLRALMDFWKKEYICGIIDEHLPQGIVAYYPMKEVAEALLGKFDAIYDREMGNIVESICNDLWNGGWPSREKEGCFPEFREMFNRIRPRHADDFLRKMEWEYGDEPETRAMLETLREDMKKW